MSKDNITHMSDFKKQQILKQYDFSTGGVIILKDISHLDVVCECLYGGSRKSINTIRGDNE